MTFTGPERCGFALQCGWMPQCVISRFFPMSLTLSPKARSNLHHGGYILPSGEACDRMGDSQMSKSALRLWTQSPEPSEASEPSHAERPREDSRRRAHAAREDLAATIENQVIPRLLLAHALPPAPVETCLDRRLPPTPDEVSRFADLAAGQGFGAAIEQVERFASEGLTAKTLLLGLLAPTARLLGQQWANDERSFADVTVGFGTLQRLVSRLGGRGAPFSHAGLVVLTCPPEEQHTFPIQLLGELCEDAGVATLVQPGMAPDEIVDILERESVSVLLLSTSNTSLVEPMMGLVREIPRTSGDEALLVLVGGCGDLERHAPAAEAVYCASLRSALDLMLSSRRGAIPLH